MGVCQVIKFHCGNNLLAPSSCPQGGGCPHTYVTDSHRLQQPRTYSPRLPCGRFQGTLAPNQARSRALRTKLRPHCRRCELVVGPQCVIRPIRHWWNNAVLAMPLADFEVLLVASCGPSTPAPKYGTPVPCGDFQIEMQPFRCARRKYVLVHKL